MSDILKKGFTVISFFLIVLSMGCSRRNDTAKLTPDSRSKSTVRMKMLADSAYQLDDFALAAKYYNEVIADDSTTGECFYKRGFSFAKLSQFKVSSNDFQKAIQLDYRVADSYFMLGMNEMINSNCPLAIIYFERCLKSNPQDKSASDALNACMRSVQRKKTS